MTPPKHKPKARCRHPKARQLLHVPDVRWCNNCGTLWLFFANFGKYAWHKYEPAAAQPRYARERGRGR